MRLKNRCGSWLGGVAGSRGDVTRSGARVRALWCEGGSCRWLVCAEGADRWGQKKRLASGEHDETPIASARSALLVAALPVQASVVYRFCCKDTAATHLKSCGVLSAAPRAAEDCWLELGVVDCALRAGCSCRRYGRPYGLLHKQSS